jgi:C4-dicarboxylate transporter/malic acid transport protein
MNRIHHFTCAWFTLPMSTGAMAVVVSRIPYQFDGLLTLGTVVYIANLIIFTLVYTAMVLRFAFFPTALVNPWKHPTEGLFIPTFFIAIASIILGMPSFAGPHTGDWLLVTLNVLFWCYTLVTLLLAVTLYYELFSAEHHTVQSMTPAWILPIFPVMLVGTVAGSIAGAQPTSLAVPIIVVGLCFQGLGLFVTMLMYALYVGRLMQSGLPAPNLRPGMFISVGPPAFAVIALTSLGEAAILHDDFFPASNIGVAAVLDVECKFAAIFLWGLSLWFFLLSLWATLAGARRMSFHLVWWSLVFPNAGFVVATITIGETLHWASLQWAGTGMSICLACVWLFVAISNIAAVMTKQILAPYKDEDKPEESFRGEYSPRLLARRSHTDGNLQQASE